VVADAVDVEPVSAAKFPANREKNREFCNFRADRGSVACIRRMISGLLSQILLNGTGNYFEGTGNLGARTGIRRTRTGDPLIIFHTVLDYRIAVVTNSERHHVAAGAT
jgi:hypothetical protein